MWKDLLEGSIDMKRFFGDWLPAGATPERLRTFSAKIERDYGVVLPPSYLEFLSFADGFELNGHRLLSTSENIHDHLGMIWANEAYRNAETFYEDEDFIFESEEFSEGGEFDWGESLKTFWFFGFGDACWYVRNTFTGRYLVNDADGRLYHAFSTVDELILHVLRQGVGGPGPQRTVDVNVRDASWKKAVGGSALLLVAYIFMVATGLPGLLSGTLEVSPVALGICAVILVLIALFMVTLLNPRTYACMQAVKGDMSYRAFQEAIARETFEQPARVLGKTGEPAVFLLSDEWVVLGDNSKVAAYIPKSNVASIEVCEQRAEHPNGASSGGQAQSEARYTLRFACKDGRAFETGLLSRTELRKAWLGLLRHFPSIKVSSSSSQ